jgi:hypothetical protein
MFQIRNLTDIFNEIGSCSDARELIRLFQEGIAKVDHIFKHMSYCPVCKEIREKIVTSIIWDSGICSKN